MFALRCFTVMIFLLLLNTFQYGGLYWGHSWGGQQQVVQSSAVRPQCHLTDQICLHWSLRTLGHVLHAWTQSPLQTKGALTFCTFLFNREKFRQAKEAEKVWYDILPGAIFTFNKRTNSKCYQASRRTQRPSGWPGIRRWTFGKSWIKCQVLELILPLM